MTKWKEIFQKTGTNSSQIDASGTLQIRPTREQIDKFSPLNSIYIINLSASDIEVRFEGVSTDALTIGANSALTFDQDYGKDFSYFDIVNLDSTNAIAADKIRYRISAIREV